jgi:plastocyanin
MNRRFSVIIVVIGLFGLLLVAGPVLAANGSVTIKEVDERYHFVPTTTYVNVGESVTWTNDSDAPHTVDSDSGGELESGNIAEGATFDHTFSATGTIAYHCDIHDYMKGSVIVLAAGITPPATNTLSSSAVVAEPGALGVVLLVLAGLAAGSLALRRIRPVE